MANVYIFTDSSTLNNGQKHLKEKGIAQNCSTGFVIRYNNTIIKRSYITESMDINRAELLGLYKSLIYVIYKLKKTDCNIYAISDNQFTIHSFNKWMAGWIRNIDKQGNLINSKNQKVANQDLIKLVYNILLKHKISLFHINSHINENNISEYHNKFNTSNNVNINIDTFKFFKKCNDMIDDLVKENLLTYMECKKNSKLMIYI